MPCDRFTELLSARLDGALTPEEERELEEHLAACPDCRAVGAQLSALQGAFPELEEADAAPEGFARGVMERIRTEKSPQKVIPLFKRPQIRALAGLAACLVLVAGLYGASRSKEQAGWDMMTRSFHKDDVEDVADSSACESLRGEENGPMVNAALADPEPADAPQITSYAAGSTVDIYGSDTENTVAPAAPSHYFFTNQQTVRLTWTEELDAPSARILGSEQSLETFAEQFPEDDLEEVLEPYDAGYFAQNRLLAVVVKEGSGSISHSIEPQGLYWDEVEIIRTVPEEVTYDMAAWLILAEVDTMFNDGDTLEVVLVERADAGESGSTVIHEEDSSEY